MSTEINAERGEFSVCQFFEDGQHEYFVRYVTVDKAMEGAHHCATSVGARAGFTKRVIITDGGDAVNFEWRYGEGIVFPPQLIGATLR